MLEELVQLPEIGVDLVDLSTGVADLRAVRPDPSDGTWLLWSKRDHEDFVTRRIAPAHALDARYTPARLLEDGAGRCVLDLLDDLAPLGTGSPRG
jgi:hypothetical protein